MSKEMKDEFYIGYMPGLPAGVGSFVRKLTLILGGMTMAAALLLAWCQKEFSSSRFDYGVYSTVKGYYHDFPLPHLAVPLGNGMNSQKLFQNVLLVGFGKTGAGKAIAELQVAKGIPFDGREIELKGFLIYGNGKALLQVTPEDNRDMIVHPGEIVPEQPAYIHGTTQVTGEIVDPKCYFGVMKPGEGKTHRSCAIRCIAGGIPPVFNAHDSGKYYIVVDENGESINEKILPLVGDKMSLSGDEIIWSDWRILKINSNKIAELVHKKTSARNVMAFENGMTTCSNADFKRRTN